MNRALSLPLDRALRQGHSVSRQIYIVGWIRKVGRCCVSRLAISRRLALSCTLPAMLVVPSHASASGGWESLFHLVFVPVTMLGALYATGVGIAARNGYFGKAFGRLLKVVVFGLGVPSTLIAINAIQMVLEHEERSGSARVYLWAFGLYLLGCGFALDARRRSRRDQLSSSSSGDRLLVAYFCSVVLLTALVVFLPVMDQVGLIILLKSFL